MPRIYNLLYPLTRIAVCALLFFFNLGQPVVIDYDEGVYAEVSREMHSLGEYIIPKLNGEDFFEKPPMLYWSQIIGYYVFDVTAYGARFFNALAGLLTILCVYYGARRPLGNTVAFNSALILSGSRIFVYLARVAMTDMLLTLFLTLSMLVSWYGTERSLNNQNGTVLFLLGCFLASLAMLTKGAIGALFPIATAVIYLISIGRIHFLLRPRWLFPGALILAAVGFSWYLLLGTTHPEGFGFMKELFMEHHVGRFSNPMEGHSGPFYFYLIVLFVGFMPWLPFLVLALAKLPVWKNSESSHRFLRLQVIFSLAVFIFFSVAATKLPNYILPALPGAALLIASYFNSRHPGTTGPMRLAALIGLLPVFFLGITLAALPFIFPYLSDLLGEDALKAPILFEPVRFDYPIWIAAALTLLSGIIALIAVRKHDSSRLFRSLLLSSFTVSASLSLLFMPIYDRLMNRPLTNLAEIAAEKTPPGGYIVLYQVSDRPSVMFTARRKTLYHSRRNYSSLPELFNHPHVTVGITTNYYFDHLQNHSIAFNEITRDGGFVLFRPAPPDPNPAQ